MSIFTKQLFIQNVVLNSRYIRRTDRVTGTSEGQPRTTGTSEGQTVATVTSSRLTGSTVQGISGGVTGTSG